jgi:hypothetical protein
MGLSMMAEEPRTWRAGVSSSLYRYHLRFGLNESLHWVGTGKFQQKNLTSTSVILLDFCTGLKEYRISAQQKTLTLAVIVKPH